MRVVRLIAKDTAPAAPRPRNVIGIRYPETQKKAMTPTRPRSN
jgi:hypothetical protein